MILIKLKFVLGTRHDKRYAERESTTTKQQPTDEAHSPTAFPKTNISEVALVL